MRWGESVPASRGRPDPAKIRSPIAIAARRDGLAPPLGGRVMVVLIKSNTSATVHGSFSPPENALQRIAALVAPGAHVSRRHLPTAISDCGVAPDFRAEREILSRCPGKPHRRHRSHKPQPVSR